MKKRKIIFALIAIVSTFSFLYYFIDLDKSTNSESVTENNSPHKLDIFMISKTIEIDCSEGTVEFENDTHGGFHNDGIAFYILEFEDNDLLMEITVNEYWSELPMDEELIELIDGRVRDKNSNQYIPAIEEGYYFFYDRFTGNDIKGFTPGILEKHPGNFTIAIYDINTNKLYYCKYDS